MYCKNCGRETNDRFCPDCGTDNMNYNNNGNSSYVENFNLFTAYKSMFEKYTQFSGRSRRSEYWYAMIANSIVGIVLYTVFIAVSGVLAIAGLEGVAFAVSMLLAIIANVYSFAVIVPSIALLVRRLHDTGKSAWYILFEFIPLVGGIIMLVFLFLDSDPGQNKYGPNPKGY